MIEHTGIPKRPWMTLASNFDNASSTSSRLTGPPCTVRQASTVSPPAPCGKQKENSIKNQPLPTFKEPTIDTHSKCPYMPACSKSSSLLLHSTMYWLPPGSGILQGSFARKSGILVASKPCRRSKERGRGISTEARKQGIESLDQEEAHPRDTVFTRR